MYLWIRPLIPWQPVVVVFAIGPAGRYFHHQKMVVVHEVACAEGGCSQAQEQPCGERKKQGMSDPSGCHSPGSPIGARRQFCPEQGHLQGRHGRFHALVAVLASRAGTRLVYVVICEDTEGHRAVVVESHAQCALRGGLANEVKVCRLATDHAADRDDGVTTGVPEKPLAGQGQLETARDAVHADVGYPGFFQNRQCPVSQGMGDFRVPFGHGQTHPQGRAALKAFRIIGGQVVSFRGHGQA